MNKKIINYICIFLIFAILCIVILSRFIKPSELHKSDDGIEQIDLDSIYLENSGVEVDFSEAIVGSPEEMRKLIVSTQEATVSMELTDSLIKKLDFDFLKKTQKISYTGKGYFVVDLDQLTKADIIEDQKNRTVTIKIGHAYLQSLEIDPEKIIIDEVKEGLLARGDIKLTVSDYNSIEKELRSRMEAEFNTAENGQQADNTALTMVKNVYEPVIKAIDARYQVIVEFK